MIAHYNPFKVSRDIAGSTSSVSHRRKSSAEGRGPARMSKNGSNNKRQSQVSKDGDRRKSRRQKREERAPEQRGKLREDTGSTRARQHQRKTARQGMALAQKIPRKRWQDST
jgi:hypothetical protein